jgi:hypothetical protein
LAEDVELILSERDVERLRRVVRYVESQAARGNGRRGLRTEGVFAFPVVMQGTMHHDKEEETIAHIWIPDEEDTDEEDRGKNFDDSLELEIWPGPFAKGLWIKGDVVYVTDKIGTQGLCPVGNGRTYFEARLSQDLDEDGTATVTINGETIEVEEGGFATATIDSGEMVGVHLSNDPSETDKNGWVWRAIIAAC